MTDLVEQVDAAYKSGGAQAAIATVLGAMKEPSHKMMKVGIEKWLNGGNERAIHAAMLQAFASEHNVEIG